MDPERVSGVGFPTGRLTPRTRRLPSAGLVGRGACPVAAEPVSDPGHWRGMDTHALGQACALLTAIIWAVALVLFKLSGERIAPIALNLFKNAIGLALLLATLGGMLAVGFESFAPFQNHSLGDVGILLFSGVIGIAVADTLFFYALNLIGVGLISIADCAYAPLAILFAWLLLGEHLTMAHFVGAALVVAGVFFASPHTLPMQRTPAQIIGGMLLAVVAVGLMAFGVVLAKPVLATFPLIWATTLRLAAGFAAMAGIAAIGDARQSWKVFRPRRSWRTAVPASVLGTYICLILWIAGFKYTHASIAAILNQTSVVFASVLAVFALREPYGVRQTAALVLALAGVFIVTFGDQLRAWL